MGILINSYVFAGYDADAQAFISAAGLTDATQKNAINDLVLDLKSASLWTKLVALYPFVGGSVTTHKFNLKDPRDLDAAYRLTYSGTVNHTSTGIQSSTGGYANTNFQISSITSIWEKGCFGYYAQNDFTLTGFHCPMGAKDANDDRMMIFSLSGGGSAVDWGKVGALNRYSAGNLQSGSYINYITGTSDPYTGKTLRNGSSAGSALINIGTNKNANLDGNMLILNRSDNFPWNGTISSAFIGYQLSDSEASSLTTIINDYQTALSRNTY